MIFQTYLFLILLKNITRVKLMIYVAGMMSKTQSIDAPNKNMLT